MNVYIIIVTYNGMAWLKKCLDSCKSYNVIVVDNASTDTSVDFIKSNYNHVHLIESTENLGFGKANNLGIRYALDEGAEHVFLLNQDAYLVDDVLDKLVDFQKNNLEYGIISPVHLTGNKERLDYYFSNYVSNYNNPYFYSDHVLENKLKEVYDIPFVNAAAWLVSKPCLEKVGGFDPLFYHYSEDNNYCQRVHFHGFKIGVIPKSYIIHDRKEVRQQKIKPYSDKYFVWKARVYKTKIANVNNGNPLVVYKQEIKDIRKSFLIAVLGLKMKNIKGIFTQYKKLKKLKNSMMLSYKNNRKAQPNYLES